MNKAEFILMGCVWFLFFTVMTLVDTVRDAGYEPMDYAMDHIFLVVLAAINFIMAVFTKERD